MKITNSAKCSARSIVAPADLTAVDQAETERRKNAAQRNHSPCFQFRLEPRGNFGAKLSLRLGRSQETNNLRPNKSFIWNGEGGPAVAQAIIAHNFNEADLDRIASIIREIGAGYIYDDADADRLQQEIVLVDVRNPVAQMIVPAPRTRMVPLSSARRKSRD